MIAGDPVQLVRRCQQSRLAVVPALGLRPSGDALDRSIVQACLASEADVVIPLVTAAAVPAHAQDHELGVRARERAARHHLSGERKPRGEQPWVASQCEEQVGGSAAAANGQSRGLHYSPHRYVQLLDVERRHARRVELAPVTGVDVERVGHQRESVSELRWRSISRVRISSASMP